MNKTKDDTAGQEINLSHKEFLKIDKDYSKAAKVIDLFYVTDKEPGIERKKTATGFRYTFKKTPVKDKSEIERIRKLAIPPAWNQVWICKQYNGHIQATGIDARGRKQYRYHTHWQVLRNETKFHRIYEFGKVLPSLRLKIEEDLTKKELEEEQVIAIVLSVMERTSIRIGNDDYEKLYGSYGLTTLKDKHVKVKGDTINFSFVGKKGIEQEITLRHKKLAKMVKQCRDIPGKELFQYYTPDGTKHSIDSGMVNRYIKDGTGGDFSAKDFRTWSGTLNILRAFGALDIPDCDATCKKNIIAALDEVSSRLGNTRTVCKKYYVHPGIIKLYEERSLQKYLKELDKIEENDNLSGLTQDEKVLMKILKDLL